MAQYDIEPFGQDQEMPAGYPIANNLNTPSAQKALSAGMGVKLKGMISKDTLFVVASDASEADKQAADYLCNGYKDELVIQAAINEVYNRRGGTIRLSRGTFSIDSFPNTVQDEDGTSYVAILIPSSDSAEYAYDVNIIGDSMPYSSHNGTYIKVSNSCYNALDASKNYKIFSARYSYELISKAMVGLFMENILIRLPWNQKKILCINLRSINRVYMRFVHCFGFTSGYNGYSGAGGNPPAKAVQGCIGIRMTGGSNHGLVNEYRNCSCAGFYEAWQVGGEHVVGVNLGGIFNVYTYTFGNYPWHDAFHHPITLINCSDERSVNFPYFAYCGAHMNNGPGGQQISLIDFTMERYGPQTPGGVLGEFASERVPGTFHGEISYTIQVSGKNVKDMPWWKDGHGKRFISRNSAQHLAGGSTERLSYAPNYLQRYWDTDLGKEVICVDTANKTWKDAMGNTV